MRGQRLLLAVAGCFMCSWGLRATTLDLSSISGPAVVEQVLFPVFAVGPYIQCMTGPLFFMPLAGTPKFTCGS